jgi:hypothetical protein
VQSYAIVLNDNFTNLLTFKPRLVNENTCGSNCLLLNRSRDLRPIIGKVNTEFVPARGRTAEDCREPVMKIFETLAPAPGPSRATNHNSDCNGGSLLQHITRQDERLCALKKEEPVLPDCGGASCSVRNAPEHIVQLSSWTNCAAASFLVFALLGRKGTDSRERIVCPSFYR